MKLSEAGRKGAEIARAAGIKHGKYSIFEFDGDAVVEACFLGEALIGKIGLERALAPGHTIGGWRVRLKELRDLFPELQEVAYDTPAGPKLMREYIIELNDEGKLSTEEIAEKLELLGM